MFGVSRLNTISKVLSSNARVTNSTFAVASGTGATATGKFSTALAASYPSNQTYRITLGTGASGQFDLNSTSQWTIELWVYIATTPNGNTNIWAVGGASGLRMSYNSSQNVYKIFNAAGSTLANIATWTGGWKHFVIQCDGSNQVKVWYAGTMVVTNGANTQSGTTTFDFGFMNTAGSSGSVRIDEIRISNTQLYPSTDPTVPGIPYTNGPNTIALFHNESTSQTDDTTS